jgi:predicted glycoside hydrolase/deacetylase ChbG (UPF0249 family)
MRVIVNADDFGHDPDSVSATIAAMQGGALTSATLMAAMPGSAAALRFAARERAFSFGAHLTFAGKGVETALAPRAGASTLTDADGRFASPNTVRLRALAGRIDGREVREEARAQLAFIADHGVSISHVDSHYHLHKLEPFRSALRDVLPGFGITRVRTAQNVRAGLRPWRPTWWTGARTAARLGAMFTSTDWFVMLNDGWPRQWWTACADLLAGDGTLEFGCHPGEREPWRRLERDAAVAFGQWCDERGIRRIDWRALGA